MCYFATDGSLLGGGGGENGGREKHIFPPFKPLSYLYDLSEASAQDRQEDTSDTDVVPGLGEPRVLAFYQHGDAPRDVSHRHLVTLQGRKPAGKEEGT